MRTPGKSTDTKETKIRIPSSWSTRSLGFRSTPKPRRPTISGPSGPVKNSRGADFTRSETLIIVGGIDDCGPEEPDFGYGHIPERVTKKLSAGFSKAGAAPLMAQPTVARSAVTATTTIQIPSGNEPSNNLKKHSLGGSASTAKLRKSSTASLLPRYGVSRQDENVPPTSPSHGVSQGPLPKSKLPKSRTMNVLHDLKASISRPSLTVRAVNSASLSSYSSQPDLSSSSSSSTTKSTSSTTLLPTSSPKLRLSRKSLVTLTKAKRPSTPERDPFRISTAQPSAYWSGRFVALHDRLSTETLVGAACPLPPPKPPGMTPMSRIDTPSTPITPHGKPGYYRPTMLSHSTTTSALPTLPANTPAGLKASLSTKLDTDTDPDAKTRSIFLHLHALCSTAEARDSLKGFQQDYARRQNRPGLLPMDGRMEERGGIMSRFFGGGGKRGESRRRMTVAKSSEDKKSRAKAKRSTLE